MTLDEMCLDEQYYTHLKEEQHKYTSIFFN